LISFGGFSVFQNNCEIVGARFVKDFFDEICVSDSKRILAQKFFDRFGRRI
jgi:hypothetical protein